MLALMTLPIISTSVSAMDGDKLSRTTDNIGVGYDQANGMSHIDLNDAFHKAWNDGDIENSIATKLGLDKDKYAESFKNIQQIEHSIVMDRTKKEKKLNIDEFTEIEFEKQGESVYDPAQNRFVHNELFTSNILITTGKGAEEEIQDYLLRLSVSNYNYVILENLLYMIADNQARTTGELLDIVYYRLLQRAGNLTLHGNDSGFDEVHAKINKSLKDVEAYVEAGGLVQFTQSIAKMADTYTDFTSNNMVIAQPKDKQDEMVNKPISNINFKQTKTGEENDFFSYNAAPLTQDGDSFNLDVFSDTPEYTPTSSIDKKAIDNALLASLRAVGSAVIKGEVTSDKNDDWKIDEMVAIFLNNITKFTQAHKDEAQMGKNLMESLGITDKNEQVSFWKVWGNILDLVRDNLMQKLPSKWFTDDSRSALTDMIRIIDRQTPNSIAKQSPIKETMQEGTNILFNSNELNNMQQSNKDNMNISDNLIANKTPISGNTEEAKNTSLDNVELNNMQQDKKDNMKNENNEDEDDFYLVKEDKKADNKNNQKNELEVSQYTINDFTFYNNDKHEQEETNSNQVKTIHKKKKTSDNQIEHIKDLNKDSSLAHSYLADSNQALLQSYNKLNENPEQTEHIIKQKD